MAGRINAYPCISRYTAETPRKLVLFSSLCRPFLPYEVVRMAERARKTIAPAPRSTATIQFRCHFFNKSITNSISSPVAFAFAYNLTISVLAAAHLQRDQKPWGLDTAHRDWKDPVSRRSGKHTLCSASSPSTLNLQPAGQAPHTIMWKQDFNSVICAVLAKIQVFLISAAFFPSYFIISFRDFFICQMVRSTPVKTQHRTGAL